MALRQIRFPRSVAVVPTALAPVLATVLATVAATTLGVLVMAEPAAARVSIVPGTVKGGGTETFAVRLANERQDMSSNRFELIFPRDVPISSVEVAPVEGWTVTVNQRPLDTPVKVDGQVVREAAESIVWEGGRVGPGQFEQFLVTLGALPRDGRLAFAATQTYANGDVDKWTDTAASGRQNSEAPAITIGSGTVANPSTSASPPTRDAAPKDQADSADRGDSAQSTGETDGQSGGDVLTLLLVLVLACIGVIFGIALVRQVRTHRSASSGDATVDAGDADDAQTADQANATDHTHATDLTDLTDHADDADHPDLADEADQVDEAGKAAATEASTR